MELPQKLSDAVRYNNKKALVIGWPSQYGLVAAVLGIGDSVPDQKQFAKMLAIWQYSKRPALKPDGKLGPKTWRLMQATAIPKNPTAKLPSWVPKPTEPRELLEKTRGKAPWMKYAVQELNWWDKEIATWTDKEKIACPELHMSRDEEYFQASPYFGGGVQPRGTLPKNSLRRHWCAAFVNWCLHTSGHSHTGAASAHSFVKRRLWRFHALDKPVRGCVAVIGKEGERANHVAFIWDHKNMPENPGGPVKIRGKRRLWILGGNQRGERVTIRPEWGRLMSCKGHNNVVSPYLWPIVGKGEVCDHGPPSEGPHFCKERFKDGK